MKGSPATAMVVFVLLWALALAAHFVDAAVPTVLLGIGFFVALHHAGIRIGGGGLGRMGFRRHPAWLRTLIAGLTTGAVCYGALFAVMVAFGRYAEIRMRDPLEIWPVLLLALVNHAYVGFWEEGLFRGFLLQLLPGRLSKARVAVIVGIIFMLSHLTKFGTVPHIHYLSWFLMGIVFLIPYWRTGSLWFSAGMHWGVNLTFTYLLSPAGLLDKVVQANPPWITDYHIIHIPAAAAMAGAVWFLAPLAARHPDGEGAAAPPA